jgi:hypothetical protein
MSWTLFFQIVMLSAVVAFCIAFVKSIDSGRKP